MTRPVPAELAAARAALLALPAAQDSVAVVLGEMDRRGQLLDRLDLAEAEQWVRRLARGTDRLAEALTLVLAELDRARGTTPVTPVPRADRVPFPTPESSLDRTP